MAYRFNGTADKIEFAISPLSGYTSGALTVAQFFKRGAVGSTEYLLALTDSVLTDKIICFIGSDNVERFYRAGGGALSSVALSSTSLWYLCVFTVSTANVVRCHLHDGTNWTHIGVGTSGGPLGIIPSDKLAVAAAPGAGTNFARADIVCSGIKKSDSSDLTVETLTRTGFQSWRDFGFDWLIGFDPSLVSGGLLQDQAPPGTGDEIARNGTTLTGDPPGWAWVATLPPVADFVSGSVGGTQPAPLTFTDLSTGATSWLWDFGDGATSTTQNPTHAFPGAGTYSVSLTATNVGGSNTKTRSVTVAGPTPGSLPMSPGPSPIAVYDTVNTSTGNGDAYTTGLTVLFSYPRTGFSVAVFNFAVFYQIATIGLNARDYRWEHGEHFLAPSFNSFNNPDHEGIAPGTKFGGIRIRAAAKNSPATVIIV